MFVIIDHLYSQGSLFATDYGPLTIDLRAVPVGFEPTSFPLTAGRTTVVLRDTNIALIDRPNFGPNGNLIPGDGFL